MIGNVLRFFKTEISGHLRRMGATNHTVQYPSHIEAKETIHFEDGLNILLVNIEEENTLRQADIFREASNGRSRPALPEVRLNLYLLFVSFLADYEKSMDLLSLVIGYFQSRRVFTPDQYPRLADYPKIEKLTAELVTLPFAQQNDIWNALRTSYKPYVLYKIRMVVFTQEDLVPDQPTIEKIEPAIKR